MSTIGDMQKYCPVCNQSGTSADPPSLVEISSLITSNVPSASAITDIVKGAVEELKRDITERIDEVKECNDNLEKNMVEKCTFPEVEIN